MKRILLLVLCCCSISYGQSRNASPKDTQPEEREWQFITFTGSRLFALNLRRFVILPNDKARFWVKDYPGNGAIKSEQAKMLKIRKERKLSIIGYEKYFSTMSQYEGDCNMKSLRILQIIDYDEDGKVLDSTDTKDLSDWTDVAPETVAENIMILACAERIIRYSKELRDAQKKPTQ